MSSTLVEAAHDGSPKILLTTTEALAAVPMSRSRLFAELRLGTIESCRIGKSRLISYASLAAWAADQLQADREMRERA